MNNPLVCLSTISSQTGGSPAYQMELTMKKIIILIITLSFFLSGCSGITAAAKDEPMASEPIVSNTVTAEGKLVPDPAVELGFPMSGTIAEILVKEGDNVSAGDVIARLDGIEAVQAELGAAQAEQLASRQALDNLHRNALTSKAEAERALIDALDAYKKKASGWSINKDKASEIELALDDYVEAEEDYREVREDLDDLLDEEQNDRERMNKQADLERESKRLAEMYTALKKEVAGFDHPLDKKQADLLAVIGRLETARELRERMDQDNLDPDVIAAAEAREKAATSHVAAAQANLEYYEITAPFGGTIMSLDGKVGETALPGIPLVYLAGRNEWTVETKDLAEIDIARVEPGQSVRIQLDAFPGEEFSGKVTEIDPVGSEYLGDMTYRVTITLDQPDERFMWNMTATVNINI